VRRCERVLGTTYDVHLGLIGKRVVNFVSALIKLFSPDVTAEALLAKIDRKSSISLQRGQFDPKIQVEGVARTIHFCTDIVRPMDAFSFVAKIFHTNKLCSRLSSGEVLLYTENGVLSPPPPYGGLRATATYDDHLKLIGTRVADFLLVLIEHFRKVLGANIGSKSTISLQRGPFNPKFEVEGVALHQPFFSL